MHKPRDTPPEGHKPTPEGRREVTHPQARWHSAPASSRSSMNLSVNCGRVQTAQRERTRSRRVAPQWGFLFDVACVARRVAARTLSRNWSQRGRVFGGVSTFWPKTARRASASAAVSPALFAGASTSSRTPWRSASSASVRRCCVRGRQSYQPACARAVQAPTRGAVGRALRLRRDGGCAARRTSSHVYSPPGAAACGGALTTVTALRAVSACAMESALCFSRCPLEPQNNGGAGGPAAGQRRSRALQAGLRPRPHGGGSGGLYAALTRQSTCAPTCDSQRAR